ncbi:hypothetical protein OIU78_026944 [Salix suchowensis]|nr:hypothetical protein OIU78_026944 [Salix suchowensis]
MAKKGSQKKDGSSRSGKRKTCGEYVEPQNMDDDIDSFHKQRDIIPLDVDADVGELSDDEEEPIFDDEAINNDEDEDDDDSQDKGAGCKTYKATKVLKSKQSLGDFDDELQDEEEDDEGAQNIVWSGNRSHDYHGGDNRDIEEAAQKDKIEVENDSRPPLSKTLPANNRLLDRRIKWTLMTLQANVSYM